MTNTERAVLTLLSTDSEILFMLGCNDWTVDQLIIAAAQAHEAGMMTVAERDRLLAVALGWERSAR
jgi:hypothetical protein